jgi:hypothetical protein
MREGKPFYVHVSPGKCPCCNWSATDNPAILPKFEGGVRSWYIVEEGTHFVGAHGSRHKMADWFTHYGIKPRRGEQICVQLVEVPMKNRRSSGAKREGRVR